MLNFARSVAENIFEGAHGVVCGDMPVYLAPMGQTGEPITRSWLDLQVEKNEFLDLIASAYAIAVRNGANTHWPPFYTKLLACMQRHGFSDSSAGVITHHTIPKPTPAPDPNLPAVLSVLANVLRPGEASQTARWNAVYIALRYGLDDADPQGLLALSLHMTRRVLGLGPNEVMTAEARDNAKRAMGL